MDGTLRVQIDIEPREKAKFLRLFPEIDMPLAIAPLGGMLRGAQTEPKATLGPLATSAMMICRSAQFREYVAEQTGDDSEEAAAGYVKEYCGIDSRKHLDSSPDGQAKFRRLMGEYRSWYEKRYGHRA